MSAPSWVAPGVRVAFVGCGEGSLPPADSPIHLEVGSCHVISGVTTLGELDVEIRAFFREHLGISASLSDVQTSEVAVRVRAHDGLDTVFIHGHTVVSPWYVWHAFRPLDAGTVDDVVRRALDVPASKRTRITEDA